MDKQITPTEAQPRTEGKPFRPVTAAFLAAGSGSVLLGILTTLAVAYRGKNPEPKSLRVDGDPGGHRTVDDLPAVLHGIRS